jgi:hypothetical protein
MKEQTFDILMISWAIIGVFIMAFLFIQLGWITPNAGIDGSQVKAVSDACIWGTGNGQHICTYIK